MNDESEKYHRGRPGLTFVFDNVAGIVLSAGFPDCHCDGNGSERLGPTSEWVGPLYDSGWRASDSDPVYRHIDHR
jgi:hypothetical protein